MANPTGGNNSDNLAPSSREDYGDDEKKFPIIAHTQMDSAESSPKPDGVELIDEEQPKGLQEMEGITVVWTKPWLIGAYCL